LLIRPASRDGRTRPPKTFPLKLRAALFLLRVQVCRVCLPGSRLLRLGVVQGLEQGLAAGDVPELVHAYAQAIASASHRLHIRNCLVKAVALRMLLASDGIASRLHVGVRRLEGAGLATAGPGSAVGRSGRPILAHAWLSVAGRVLLGGEEAGFYETEFHTLGESGR
jgi:hypothetical protein